MLVTGSRRPVYEVVVGVLSARHHYELRDALRGTWMGYLRDHPDFQNRCVFLYLFVDGIVVKNYFYLA